MVIDPKVILMLTNLASSILKAFLYLLYGSDGMHQTIKKQLRSQLPNYFWCLKMGGLLKQGDVNPTWTTQSGCKYTQIKDDSLHFNLIFIVSFEIQCNGVQRAKRTEIVPLSKYLWTVFYSLKKMY